MVNFEHISHLFLVFLLMTFNRQMLDGLDLTMIAWLSSLLKECFLIGSGILFLTSAMLTQHIKMKISKRAFLITSYIS